MIELVNYSILTIWSRKCVEFLPLCVELQEEHRIDATDVAKGSLCVMPSCDVSSSIDNSNDEDMCVVLVNSNFDFINTTEIEDFRPTKVDVVSIDLTIKGVHRFVLFNAKCCHATPMSCLLVVGLSWSFVGPL